MDEREMGSSGVVGRSFTCIYVNAIDMLVAFFLSTSAVMVTQLIWGRFDPIWGLFLGTLACGALGWFVKEVKWPRATRALYTVCFIGLLAMACRWSPFLYSEGGQDQGVYVSMSAHFARSGSPLIIDKVREQLPESKRAQYDELNNSHHRIVVPHRFEGGHQPGVYIANLGESKYIFQFYPLHPLWMAVTARIWGSDNRVYSLVVLSVLSVLMLALLAYELSGRKMGAALITGLLISVSPIHVFLSRFPVTENVTVFFSATALYYFARYIRVREEGEGHSWLLGMSAAAWAALFFSHIGGFLYAPIILVMLALSAATSVTAAQGRQIIAYGLVVVGAYLLSVWYGVTWSFPYSYDIYRIHFGEWAGQLLLQRGNLAATAALMLLLAPALVYGSWHFRTELRGAYSRLRFHHWLNVAILTVILGTIGYASFEAYRLGFTDHFAGDKWLAETWKLNHAGAIALGRSSLVTLAIYVSPFLLLFVLAAAVLRRRTLALSETVLLLLIGQFLIVRTALQPFTPYYYYGRYIGAELVPYITVFGALLLVQLAESPQRARRAAALGIIALTVAWELGTLVPQYRGGEMQRFDKSIQPLVEKLSDKDILLLAGVRYPELQTALDYYHGKHTAAIELSELRQWARQYGSSWADVYVLSERDNLTDVRYVKAITVARDFYDRSGLFAVLPTGSRSIENRYYLYQVSRPELAGLRPGDIIAFGSSGNATNYLGRGWSAQEPEMRWTQGDGGNLSLSFSGTHRPTMLKFEVRSFNCGSVAVRVNGEFRTRWTFTDCNGYVEKDIPLKSGDLQTLIEGAGTNMEIRLETPDSRSPHELDPRSGDIRKLGISVKNIRVE